MWWLLILPALFVGFLWWAIHNEDAGNFYL
jgi:hypothetical protein